MSEKTVFISYRRDATGKAFARSIKQELKHHGYDAFLDVDCIDAGKWAAQIHTQVPKRAHFLLLLTPGALDRCADKNDWVRREFLLALERSRNIVPVREESVDPVAMRAAAPEAVKAIFDFQIHTIQHGSFESDVEALTTRYIHSHKAPKQAISKSTNFQGVFDNGRRLGRLVGLAALLKGLAATRACAWSRHASPFRTSELIGRRRHGRRSSRASPRTPAWHCSTRSA